MNLLRSRLDRLHFPFRPEFKREFSLWTSFCVSFAVLGLLPSFASTLYFGMGYAGTAGMVWGWIIAMVFIHCVAMGMGTLVFAWPAVTRRWIDPVLQLSSARRCRPRVVSTTLPPC